MDSMQETVPREIQARPVTRFLPDATRDPAVDLAHVGYRLATLSAFTTSAPVSRVRLAEAGFYSRGQGDEVTCFSCHTRHSGWTREDNPMEVHRRLSPQCPHVLHRERETGTLTVGDGGGGAVGGASDGGSGESVLSSHTTQTSATEHVQDSQAPRQSRGQLEPLTQPPQRSTGSEQRPEQADNGRRRTQTRPSSTVTAVAESRSGGRSTGPSNARTDTSHGPEPRPLFPRAGLELGGAVYPFHQDMASRRRTFTSWDDSQAPPLDQVLLCGMFHAGYADCVRCFYCGVGLKHWVVTDDVWTEHVRWRPDCGYLRAVKGDSFIRDTQRRLGAESWNSRPESQESTMANHITEVDSALASTTASTSSAVFTTTSTTTPPATTARSTETRRASSSSSSLSSARSAQASSSVSSAVSSAPTGPRGTAVTATSATPAPASTADRQGADHDHEDRERLARLQAENRALNRRLQCRMCERGTIDTILMPCGHLVVCQDCAPSLTSCPLCHQAVRATARVHMA